MSRFCRLLYARPVVNSAFLGVFASVASEVSSRLDQVVANVLLACAFTAAGGLLLLINGLRGQARYAVLTSFASVGCWMGGYLLFRVLDDQSMSLNETLWLSAVVLFLTALLAMFLSFAAMLGAFIKIRREASHEEKQDRLQLLQRIFDLQEQLSAAPASRWHRSRWDWVESARDRWLWVALAAGFGVGFILLLERVTLGLPTIDEAPQTVAFFGVANFVLIAIVVPSIGFISGTLSRGLASGVLFAVTKSLFDVIATGVPQSVSLWSEMLITSAGFILIAGIGGVAGTIEERGQRSMRLAAADQTTILSEIIRLQQLLQTGSAEIFVMFVDVVKSTQIKAGKDPLKVEASFRAFHEFIGRTVRQHGGSIHSVSGDGAVAKFNVAADILAAARAVQRDIGGFNTEANRLDLPFRVRIGLHCGEVHGELDQVVFTNVVDVAAHIEKYAPPGGIVVTDNLREQLQLERFAQLEEAVDGHSVYLVLDLGP
jgi:class 3 adenylate cyclase